MDKIDGIDDLIRAARIAEGSGAPYAEGELELARERVIDSIHAWCDCGKGSLCPQYGNEFQHA